MRTGTKFRSAIAALAMLAASPAIAQEATVVSSPTLDAIKQRGTLSCGVFNSRGFSLPDSQGVMRGIDVDQCRAIAAATLGDSSKVKYVVLTPAQRLAAVQSGEVDVLFAAMTWTFSREVKTGVLFTNPYNYTGLGFIVRKSLGVDKAAGLDGASVCVLGAGTGERALQEYFTANGMSYSSVVLAQGEEARSAFLAGRCDAYLTDVSALAIFKATQGDAADDFVILPERLTSETLSGVVRKGDDNWFDIVRWTHYAMVQAEILGITSDNIDSFAGSDDPNVRSLLGVEGDLGKALGLANDWAANAIRQVGNFGQIWERAFTGIDRGMNNVWTKGGLQYAPTFQ